MNNIFGYAFLYYPEKGLDFDSIRKRLFAVYPCAISPLHSPDGKKPHIHIHIYQKLKQRQIVAIHKMLGYEEGAYVEQLRSGYASFMYLIHKDIYGVNLPHKEVFDFQMPEYSDLLEPEDFIDMREVAECDLMCELLKFIYAHDEINEISELFPLLCDNPDLLQYAWKSELKCKHIIDSLRWKKKSKISLDTNKPVVLE